jgi:5'-nucleotidase
MRCITITAFLSAKPSDVRKALEAGFADATIFPSVARLSLWPYPAQLRIAFDGDAVWFSDESERICKRGGSNAFESNERPATQLIPIAVRRGAAAL